MPTQKFPKFIQKLQYLEKAIQYGAPRYEVRYRLGEVISRFHEPLRIELRRPQVFRNRDDILVRPELAGFQRIARYAEMPYEQTRILLLEYANAYLAGRDLEELDKYLQEISKQLRLTAEDLSKLVLERYDRP